MKAEFVGEQVIDVIPETPKPALRERLRQRFTAAIALLQKAWNETDIEDLFFFLGLVLVAIGIYQIRPAVAAIVAGTILILFVRPLRRWF